MYLVDSEGLLDTENDDISDRKIISLVVLLSSYLIFNSTGVIDSGTLDQLALTLELTKHLSLPPDVNLASVFPTLMWVLRDFQSNYPVDANGVQITSRQYLENALSSKSGAAQSLNETRKKIRRYFQKRDCCTLVRPIFDNEGLEHMHLSDMRPEFQANAKVLKQSVLTNQRPVSMNSVKLSGEQYFKLAESFVAALN